MVNIKHKDKGEVKEIYYQIRNFPSGLFTRVKLFSARYRVPMKAVIMRALTKYLDEHEKR